MIHMPSKFFSFPHWHTVCHTSVSIMDFEPMQVRAYGYAKYGYGRYCDQRTHVTGLGTTTSLLPIWFVRSSHLWLGHPFILCPFPVMFERYVSLGFLFCLFYHTSPWQLCPSPIRSPLSWCPHVNGTPIKAMVMHYHQLHHTVVVGGGASSLLLCSLYTTKPLATPHAFLNLVSMDHSPHFGSAMQHNKECDVTWWGVSRHTARSVTWHGGQHGVNVTWHGGEHNMTWQAAMQHGRQCNVTRWGVWCDTEGSAVWQSRYSDATKQTAWCNIRIGMPRHRVRCACHDIFPDYLFYFLALKITTGPWILPRVPSAQMHACTHASTCTYAHMRSPLTCKCHACLNVRHPAQKPKFPYSHMPLPIPWARVGVSWVGVMWPMGNELPVTGTID